MLKIFIIFSIARGSRLIIYQASGNDVPRDMSELIHQLGERLVVGIQGVSKASWSDSILASHKNWTNRATNDTFATEKIKR